MHADDRWQATAFNGVTSRGNLVEHDARNRKVRAGKLVPRDIAVLTCPRNFSALRHVNRHEIRILRHAALLEREFFSGRRESDKRIIPRGKLPRTAPLPASSECRNPRTVSYKCFLLSHNSANLSLCRAERPFRSQSRVASLHLEHEERSASRKRKKTQDWSACRCAFSISEHLVIASLFSCSVSFLLAFAYSFAWFDLVTFNYSGLHYCLHYCPCSSGWFIVEPALLPCRKKPLVFQVTVSHLQPFTIRCPV